MTSMYASPAMTSMIAPSPARYVQATPVVTATPSMAPPRTNSMIATTSMLAPPVVAAAAPAGSSFVAPPMTAQPVILGGMAATVVGTPSYSGPVFSLPPPVSLTQGIPDPEAIEKQKEGYSKSLDFQLKQGTEALMAQGQVQKDMIEQTCKTQMAEHQLQIESQLKLSSLQVDQHVQAQVVALQEAAITQKTLLEEKAALALLDYRKRKAAEEMSIKSYQVQKEYFDREAKLMGEYQKVARGFGQTR